MSNDLNQCQFIGRLGKDAEVRYTSGGKAVANFTLAVGSSWKSDGEKKESTEWVRCTAFEKLAEICGEYLRKGKQCYVSGRMATRKWTDKDGVERYTTEITVQTMQLLGGRDEGERTGDAQKPSATPKAAARPPTSFDDMDSDIPF